MTNWIVLDVAIGLIFIFLLYSLLATVIQELLATLFGFRAKMLERAVCRMLHDEPMDKGRAGQLKGLFRSGTKPVTDKSLLSRFYQHPLLLSLGATNQKLPSYITAKTFSSVLVDVLTDHDRVTDLKTRLSKTLNDTGELGLVDPQTLLILRKFWIETEQDVNAFRQRLENWFDETQVRCTGWYKKNTQYVLLAIGLVIAIGFNVDTISIAGKFQKDPKLRELVVNQAETFQKAHPNLLADRQKALSQLESAGIDSTAKDSAEIVLKQYDALIARGAYLQHEADSLVQHDVSKLNGILGLGLKGIFKSHPGFFLKNTSHKMPVKAYVGQFFKALGSWMSTLVGWLIAALAISLGAPFWFDLLNKFMQLKQSLGSESKKTKSVTT